MLAISSLNLDNFDAMDTMASASIANTLQVGGISVITFGSRAVIQTEVPIYQVGMSYDYSFSNACFYLHF